MILDGRSIAEQLNMQTKKRVAALSFQPLLIDVLIGSDPASLSYVKIKQRKAEACGFAFELIHLSSDLDTEQVVLEMHRIITKPNLCGLLVQLPLPAHLDEAKILYAIPRDLDVDVLNENSREAFYANTNTFVPPTAGAIMHIVQSVSESWHDKQFLVLGQGELVGKPITHLLKQSGYKVMTADSNTMNVNELLSNADCIISGVGKPRLVTGENLTAGCVVIDAGTSEANGAITGDVDFASVEPIAKYITPVPGGVGPVTVAKLLENVVVAAEQK